MDELDLIRWIRGRTRPAPDVPIGIGDDCAGLHLPDGRTVLVTTDMLIAGVHFLPDTPARKIGHKAVARAVSDIAAMAGEPAALVVALAAPKGTKAEFLQELFLGMEAVSDRLGARIVGGDVSSGDLPLALTVTVLGSAPSGRAVLRSGARPGDAVMVTGELGGSPLGRHLDFLPRVSEALWLRDRAALHAMIDVSDGLGADASHLAEESGVGMEIGESCIPISEAAERMAERSGRSALEHALADGEDYELLFTVSAEEGAWLESRDDAPVLLTRIGTVTEGGGLWLRRADGRRERLPPRGWVHEF